MYVVGFVWVLQYGVEVVWIVELQYEFVEDLVDVVVFCGDWYVGCGQYVQCVCYFEVDDELVCIDFEQQIFVVVFDGEYFVCV